MKVKVDSERCQGHTLCAMLAPKAFQLDEVDGHSQPVTEDVSADMEEQVRQAVSSCPERAISISE